MHPILFQFGPLVLYSYGLTMAIGFLIAVRLAGWRARAVGIDPAKIQNLSLVALVAGILGARLAFILLNLEIFLADPIEMIRLDHGGLVFYGGLILGISASILYIRKAGLRLWPTLDLMIPPLVLAHAIGRIGCFLNGCCYGKPTELPWGVIFHNDVIKRHPTQLYETGALLLIFWFLKRLERRSLKPGTVILSYGLLYGIWRFSVEFLRGDNPEFFHGLTIFQVGSLLLASACLFLLARRAAR